MSLRLLMLTTLPLLPITVHAGELPKEGERRLYAFVVDDVLKHHEGRGSNGRNV
jgi:hypothetical protein